MIFHERTKLHHMIKEFRAKPRSRAYSSMELTINEWKQDKMITHKDGNFNALGSQSPFSIDPLSLSSVPIGSSTDCSG